jgi:acyl-CoA synthetase (AMP-forming)/AMP-acid ligase II
MATTLHQLINSSTNEFGDKPAIIIPAADADHAEVVVSYRSLQNKIEECRQKFAQYGIRPHDVISSVLVNNLEFVVSFLATTNVKAIAAPLNPAYKKDEFKFYLEDIKAKIVLVPSNNEAQPAREAAKELNIPLWEISFTHSGGDVHVNLNPLDHVESPAAVKPEDPTESDVALYLHTSGTTSRPKLVPLTHLNLCTSIGNIADSYKLTKDDSSMIVMPLFHVHGLLGGLLSTLKSGGTAVIPPRFSASTFWPQIIKHKVTWYTAVPTIHQILLSRASTNPTEFESVKFRFIRSCSSALAPAVFEQLENTFKAPVLEAYGMTEASHQMASNPINGKRKVKSVGVGTNVQIAILDDAGNEMPQGEKGQVCIKGKNVTLGYHNNPDANKANWTSNGWFCTGDQGYLDEEGYLFLTGRIKELINRGGEKISPLEIDGVLFECPNVSDAICFAVPDAKYGEDVFCAVVLKDTSLNTSEEDVKAFCRTKLAEFKVPKKVFITDSFPRTATGKIQRRFVAEHFLKQMK